MPQDDNEEDQFETEVVNRSFSERIVLIVSKFWSEIGATTQVVVSCISIIFAATSIAAAFFIGYNWSLRGFSILPGGGVHPSSYLRLTCFAVFIPGVLSTVAYGLLRISFRQVTRDRNWVTKAMLKLRQFTYRRKFVLIFCLWSMIAIGLYLPVSFFLEVFFVISAWAWILYISAYAGEFRFSIKE
ncbi:hypothetical protein, partial [Rhodovulum sulfidophilum]|uniref:hypothetical protein n=1 Tax=Rhodovulum sulfidophilum TaxID=35806 RepID=UPI001F2E7559